MEEVRPEGGPGAGRGGPIAAVTVRAQAAGKGDGARRVQAAPGLPVPLLPVQRPDGRSPLDVTLEPEIAGPGDRPAASPWSTGARCNAPVRICAAGAYQRGPVPLRAVPRTAVPGKWRLVLRKNFGASRTTPNWIWRTISDDGQPRYPSWVAGGFLRFLPDSGACRCRTLRSPRGPPMSDRSQHPSLRSDPDTRPGHHPRAAMRPLDNLYEHLSEDPTSL
jgi:hypothetical protein